MVCAVLAGRPAGGKTEQQGGDGAAVGLAEAPAGVLLRPEIVKTEAAGGAARALVATQNSGPFHAVLQGVPAIGFGNSSAEGYLIALAVVQVLVAENIGKVGHRDARSQFRRECRDRRKGFDSELVVSEVVV